MWHEKDVISHDAYLTLLGKEKFLSLIRSNSYAMCRQLKATRVSGPKVDNNYKGHYQWYYSQSLAENVSLITLMTRQDIFSNGVAQSLTKNMSKVDKK